MKSSNGAEESRRKLFIWGQVIQEAIDSTWLPIQISFLGTQSSLQVSE